MQCSVLLPNEEEQIRTKYEFRKTDMMKKAFGNVEEDLKKEHNKNENHNFFYLFIVAFFIL